MLTAERLRELLDYDPETGVFTRLVRRGGNALVGSRAGAVCSNGYRYLMVDGTSHCEHRLVWLHVHGVWPTDHLDHVNGVKCDNRIANLRECTHAENHQNLGVRRCNTSGHPGVSWYKAKGKWQAYINTGGERKHLGYFDTAEEAGAAYLEAKKQFHKFQPALRNS